MPEKIIPTKILKDNKGFFVGYFQMFFNDAIASSKSPLSFKMAKNGKTAKIKAIFKKKQKFLKENTGLSVSFLGFKDFWENYLQAINTFFW